MGRWLQASLEKKANSYDTIKSSYIKININDIPSKGHMQGLSKLLEVDVPSQTQSKTKAGPINGIYFITVEGPDCEKVTKDIIDACNGVDIKAQLSSEQEYNDAVQSLSK